jgi:endonuclease-3 related protein
METSESESTMQERMSRLEQQLVETYPEVPGGPDGSWWPAGSAVDAAGRAFEIAVGAVLTQNTNWSNVERAIANLKTAGALNLQALVAVQPAELAQLIRPSGYYNIKAERLRQLCLYLDRSGGLDALREQPLEVARSGLLSVKGVGPETADDILLYALDRPVFVIDTYTRRLLERHALAHGGESYEALRLGFENVLPADPVLFKQYHALIVQHAKQACRKQPACGACCLQASCPASGLEGPRVP